MDADEEEGLCVGAGFKPALPRGCPIVGARHASSRHGVGDGPCAVPCDPVVVSSDEQDG